MDSSEVLKLAAASLVALAVFVILLTFAMGPVEGDEEVQKIGGQLLDYTQNTSKEILKYE